MDQGRRDYGKRNWEPRKRPEFPDENLQIIIYDLSPTITKEDVKYILGLFVRCLHFPEIKTKEEADKCIERLEYSNTTTCWYITFSSQKYRDAILDLDEKILFPDWKYCKLYCVFRKILNYIICLLPILFCHKFDLLSLYLFHTCL